MAEPIERAHPAGAPVVVARMGDALALLVDSAPAGKKAHLSLAEAALRTATGDPSIVLGRRPSGRPRVLAPLAELGVSLSSRGALLAVGFSPTRDVGVDIEIDDPAVDPQRLARDHFTPSEAHLVDAAGDPLTARDRFLRLWTVKEAVLKATGRGVFDGLAEPDFSGVAEALFAGGVPVDVAAQTRTPAARVMATDLLDAGRRVWVALAVLR